MRQASIGIRRMPSSTALRQVAQHPNASKQRLSTPLPALDEDHELGLIRSHGSESALTNAEPEQSRVRKAKSAIQMRVPFWGGKNKGNAPQTNGTAAHEDDMKSMNYTSDMVDVLDTIGTYS